MVCFSRPSRKGEDLFVEEALSNGDRIRVVFDGHGPATYGGVGIQQTKLLVNALATRVLDFFKAHPRQSDTGVGTYCREIQEVLMGEVAEFLAEEGRTIAQSEIMGSTISCVLTSPEDTSCVIWSGDSPVYSLSTWKRLTPLREARPVRSDIELHSQGRYVSIGPRLYPNTSNNAYAGNSIDSQAFAVDFYPLVPSEEYADWIMTFWKGMNYWNVSDEFSGPFLMASDGIDYLRREFTRDDLMELATHPWRLVDAKYGERYPDDDITVFSTIMEQEPKQDSVRETAPKSEPSDTNLFGDFMLIPE